MSGAGFLRVRRLVGGAALLTGFVAARALACLARPLSFAERRQRLTQRGQHLGVKQGAFAAMAG